jgi:hypothetical protein
LKKDVDAARKAKKKPEDMPKAGVGIVNLSTGQATMGFVDPARVGIQGHSWGGYQISYMITKTNIFRAVEAGASVGDMFGGYGGIRWGTGMSRAFQYEKTQSRIGVPPWKNPLIYMENSPLFWIENIHTPSLTMAKVCPSSSARSRTAGTRPRRASSRPVRAGIPDA